jgi:hypothetical protein
MALGLGGVCKHVGHVRVSHTRCVRRGQPACASRVAAMAVSMLSSLVAKLGAGGQGACLLVGTRLADGTLLAVDTLNSPGGDSSVPGFDAVSGEAARAGCGGARSALLLRTPDPSPRAVHVS